MQVENFDLGFGNGLEPDSSRDGQLGDSTVRYRFLGKDSLFCEKPLPFTSIPTPMMKKKVLLEYPFSCTPGSLYRAITTPLGLGSWFADRVEATGDRYEFFWNKTGQAARVVHRKPNLSVRYEWLDEEGHYFEFRLSHQELTGDLLLTVIDFAEEAEVEDCRTLWDAQIEKLKRAIGCPKK